MGFSEEEARFALEYMKPLEITAELDPADGKTLCFNRSHPFPDTISEEVRSILEICIEYHQRSVFTGEHLAQDSKPPIFQSGGDPILEINFFLKHYHYILINEVEKGLDLNVPTEEEMRPKLKNSDYVKAMLEFRKQQRKNN